MLCQLWLGPFKVTSGEDRSSQFKVILGQVRPVHIRLKACQVRSGQDQAKVTAAQVRLGQNRTGQGRSGQGKVTLGLSPVRSRKIRSCQDQMRPGQGRSCHVSLGQVRCVYVKVR